MGISDESRDTIGSRNMVTSGLLDLDGAGGNSHGGDDFGLCEHCGDVRVSVSFN